MRLDRGLGVISKYTNANGQGPPPGDCQADQFVRFVIKKVNFIWNSAVPAQGEAQASQRAIANQALTKKSAPPIEELPGPQSDIATFAHSPIDKFGVAGPRAREIDGADVGDLSPGGELTHPGRRFGPGETEEILAHALELYERLFRRV